MKTGIYWQDPKYPGSGMDFIFDPSLALYLPLHKLDGVSFISRDTCGHLCTVTGALWTPRGRDFDGVDDYMEVPAHASLNLTDAMTYEQWVWSANYSSLQGLMDKYVYLTRGFHGRVVSNRADFFIHSSGTSVSTTIPLVNRKWHHLVFTYDKTLASGNMKVYVDSEFDASADETNGITSHPNDNLIIGKYDTYEWGGLISEVRVYNRALNPLEVQRNYLATRWRYQ